MFIRSTLPYISVSFAFVTKVILLSHPHLLQKHFAFVMRGRCFTTICYKSKSYKNYEYSYKSVTKGIIVTKGRKVTKSNGPEFLLHINEDSDAASRPHVTFHSKRSKCLNRKAAFDGCHLRMSAYDFVTIWVRVSVHILRMPLHYLRVSIAFVTRCFGVSLGGCYKSKLLL